MQITHLTTAGNHDPAGPPEHENNVWIVGDDEQVIVIDPAHDAQAVAEAVGDREVLAIVQTHGHWDHVRASPAFAELVDAPVLLHAADDFLWRQEHPEVDFVDLSEDTEYTVAGEAIVVLHTPGHTPGSTSLYVPSLKAVFTGDTLFEGGPGATRWDYASFETIIRSIEDSLFSLDDDVAVHTGHGPSTTIGQERQHLQEWVQRGW